MHGFGIDGFGTVGFGLYQPELATVPNRTITQARELDELTREPILVDGAFVDTHPVDQEVLLALGTTRGSIMGMPNFGSGIMSITHIDDAFESKVRAKIHEALSKLIQAKKISLTNIIIETSPNSVEVQYKNLIKNSPERIVL